QKKLEDGVLSFSFCLERLGHSTVPDQGGPLLCEGEGEEAAGLPRAVKWILHLFLHVPAMLDGDHSSTK
ncbi:MAG: hypothetical protein KJS98_16460, partial [Nitrospirae bacterium]|nr:hypothetical protein [Nitrospirota bacterium]